MSTYSGDTPLTRFLATQTAAQLKALRTEYRGEIESAQARISDLQADLLRIDQALAERGGRSRQIKSTPLFEPASAVEAAPSLRASIVAVVRESPDRAWSKDAILEELDRHGVAPGGAKPMNTLGNRLSELVRDGELVRTGRAEYQSPNGDKASGRNPLLMGAATREAENDAS